MPHEASARNFDVVSFVVKTVGIMEIKNNEHHIHSGEQMKMDLVVRNARNKRNENIFRVLKLLSKNKSHKDFPNFIAVFPSILVANGNRHDIHKDSQ